MKKGLILLEGEYLTMDRAKTAALASITIGAIERKILEIRSKTHFLGGAL